MRMIGFAFGALMLSITPLISLDPDIIDPRAFGAQPCPFDSTAAMQAAYNAASAPGGPGQVYAPPMCLGFTKLNAANISDVKIIGVGARSILQVMGSDSAGNWIDWSGASRIGLRDLAVIDNGIPVPRLFAWLCTGSSCNQSGVLTGLEMINVTVSAKTTNAIFYGYGYLGCSITDSHWIETNNGSSTADATARNAVLHLSGGNDANVRSANANVTSTAAAAWGCVITNSHFIDSVPGTGDGSISANAAFICNECGPTLINGGSFRCNCRSDVVMWNNAEGNSFHSVSLLPTSGGANSVYNFFDLGGGMIGYLMLDNSFFSAVAPGGVYIGFDVPVNGVGGIGGLFVSALDVGGNPNNGHFIAPIGGANCSGFNPGNYWIFESDLHLIYGANTIVSCGSIDAATTISNGVVVTTSGGANLARMN